MDGKNASSKLFSLRIVTIDSYMKVPIFGLDTCYSEFRGNEIKQVPVIRIFGTDANGVKTCAHVHGVFPYLYIPYAGGENSGDVDRLAYQLATSLDKALNISLGQANSSTQHIFKIILVKGLPFYGYHKNEHKFLKIFLYNPAFIRRTANFLQNGAILGRIFQPHESHVPFILQFMIDFNLYGMSFLHVPAKMVQYRQQKRDESNDGNSLDSDDELLDRIDPTQVLDKKIERMSTSKQEIDIAGAFILNRLQVPISEKSEHANPGIAFIWSDERARRHKIIGEVPPLVTQEMSQDRGKLAPVESEMFHRAALSKALERISSSSDSPQNSDDLQQTSENISILDQTLQGLAHKKFNLNQFLQNSVYPAECEPNSSQDLSSTILNASCLVDHLRCSKYTDSDKERSVSRSSQLSSGAHSDLDESIVDEDLVLGLTQKVLNTTLMNETFNENEHDVLDILELLEEDEQGRDEETCIDADSTLAPLSQKMETLKLNRSQCIVSTTQLNQSTLKEANNFISSFTEEDSDDDLLNEFSMSMLEIKPNEVEENRECNNFKIPQFDGSFDTPVKKTSLRKNVLQLRAGKKYNPLNVSVSKGPNIRINGTTDDAAENSGRPAKQPKLHLIDVVSAQLDENNAVILLDSEDEVDEASTSNASNNDTQSDSAKSTSNYESLIHPFKDQLKNVQVNLIKYTDIEKKFNHVTSDKIEDKMEVVEPPPAERRYPQRNRKPRTDLTGTYLSSLCGTEQKKPKHHPKKQNEEELDKLDLMYSSYAWSECKLAEQYDKDRKFVPEPGPSTINYYENDIIDGYYKPITKPTSRARRKRSNSNESNDANGKRAKTEENGVPRDPLDTEYDYSESVYDYESDGIMVHSFYGQSFIQNTPIIEQDSPDMFVSPVTENDDGRANTTILTPMVQKFLETVVSDDNEKYMIRPQLDPPNKDDVNAEIKSNQILPIEHPTPYYSDPADIIPANAKKEIGQTVLRLRGRSTNDCEEFKSSNVNIIGLNEMKKQFGKNCAKADLNISSKRSIQIRPITEPPTLEAARAYLREMHDSAQSKNNNNLSSPDKANGKHSSIALEDSPVKTTYEQPSAVIEISDESNDSTDPNSNLGITLSKILANKEISLYSNSKNAKNEIKTMMDLEIINGNESSNHNNNNNTDTNKNNLICADQMIGTASGLLNDNFERSSFLAHLHLDDSSSKSHSPNSSFGIKAATMDNSFGFKMDLENFQCAKSNIEHNYLTILSVEIHCQTRLSLLPDPAHDEITCIFYAIHNDAPQDANSTESTQEAAGVVINTHNQPSDTHRRLGINTNVTYVQTENDLLMEFIKLIRLWDPDIFAGYEIELASWGYIIQRCQVIGVDIIPMISRIPTQRVAKFRPVEDENQQQEEFFGAEYDSEYKLYGRILLDVWRLLRGEIALTSYSFENIMYHVLHRRYPLFSKEKLTRLWTESINKWIVIEYYLDRAKGTLEILNQLDLVGRTCELAKLFGIQFYEVLSRGSQFRVESMMLRIAKPKNLIPVSPSVQQRAHMKSPEYLPLILEPRSRFYADPLIVLDFQSLYPSMIIAYNYCFSTCLGRVEHLGQSQPFEFGASQLRVSPRLLDKLYKQNLLNISPCGAVFVKSSVREGVLPRMLREILDTRLMVKQSMKLHKKDKLLQRVLHSRQLGLKLMANVTYGYTAANFSGRMPCVEVGDSVVSKGRETLERAIKTVEANEQWGCRVIYGDTDSLFVLVPGRSREDAFRIGNEIADTITKENPHPVKLKLEKVYQPSILQTKKRYVGYMYESADQAAPVYEAKGIETVRRDGCPAVAKMLEKTLRILFETCDVSAVKRYICRQFTKVLSGQASVQDLIFAKEFRGINGYKPGACVPALELTRAAQKIDYRAEPRRGERVPYLVINGPPGVPLIRLVRSPHEYLTNEGYKINAEYYITKVLIPPINRCLLLIGADAHQWYADLPRKSQYLLSLDVASNVINKKNPSENASSHTMVRGVGGVLTTAPKKSTISQYFSSTNCVCDCGGHTHNGICSSCLLPKRRQQSTLILIDKCMQLEHKLNACMEICASCCGQKVDSTCISLDCSVLFMLNRWKRETKQIQFYRQLLDQHF